MTDPNMPREQKSENMNAQNAQQNEGADTSGTSSQGPGMSTQPAASPPPPPENSYGNNQPHHHGNQPPQGPEGANPYAPSHHGGHGHGHPGKSPVLSILSLIAGILGVVGFFVVFIPFLGSIMQLFVPGAAVVLGFIGRAKEPQSKAMWLTGIILGFVGLAIAILGFILWAVIFASNPVQYNVPPGGPQAPHYNTY